MENNSFSYNITVFHERSTPEEGYLAGYAAILNSYDPQVHLTDVLSIISHKHKTVGLTDRNFKINVADT